MDMETVVSSPETPELIKIPINEHLNVLYIISLVNPGTYVHRLSVFYYYYHMWNGKGILSYLLKTQPTPGDC